ncbi:hypothetical protein [Streptomyces sp. 135]|uniref:hypothetical protein n=1 Tax=Streptomyces sp. 135 TaxID=2838850 RepID=UPI001CBF854D|nr:hypothetical protein [Streptomyces sp. 135]
MRPPSSESSATWALRALCPAAENPAAAVLRVARRRRPRGRRRRPRRGLLDRRGGLGRLGRRVDALLGRLLGGLRLRDGRGGATGGAAACTARCGVLGGGSGLGGGRGGGRFLDDGRLLCGGLRRTGGGGSATARTTTRTRRRSGLLGLLRNRHGGLGRRNGLSSDRHGLGNLSGLRRTGGSGSTTARTTTRTRRRSGLLGLLRNRHGGLGRRNGLSSDRHGLGNLSGLRRTGGSGSTTARTTTRTRRRSSLLLDSGRNLSRRDSLSSDRHGLGNLSGLRRTGGSGGATARTTTRTRRRSSLLSVVRGGGLRHLGGLRRTDRRGSAASGTTARTRCGSGLLGHLFGLRDLVDLVDLVHLVSGQIIFGGGGGRYGRSRGFGGTRGRARGTRRGAAPTARRQGVAGAVVLRSLSGVVRLKHAGGSPVTLPGAAPVR